MAFFTASSLGSFKFNRSDSHILEDRHMWEKVELLENHPIFRR